MQAENSYQQDTGMTQEQSNKVNLESEDFNPLEYASSSKNGGNAENLKYYGASPDNDQDDSSVNVVSSKKVNGHEPEPVPEPEEDGEEQNSYQSQSTKEQEKEQDQKEEHEHIKVAKGLSRLAKKDAALRAKEAELREQEKKLSALLQLAEELEKDPASAVSKIGLDPDKLYMNELEKKKHAEETRIQQLERKIEEMQRGFDARQKEQEARSKGERWEMDFDEHFNKPDYAMVRAWDPEGTLVRQMVAQRYEKTGKLMSPWKALDTLQKQITEKVSRLNDVGSVNLKQTSSNQKKIPPKQPTRTVTPSASTAPSRAVRELLSDEEDMERIAQKYISMQGHKS